MRRKRIADSQKGVGMPKVGGPFQLIDQNGKTFTDQNLKGRYSLVSKLTRRHLPARIPEYGLLKLSCCIGLLWLHALPGYLPRGAR